MSVLVVRAGWQSWHLGVPRPQEPFLILCLYPWILRESADARLRRFFFVRLDEEGPAIRLRAMVGRRACLEDVEKSLTEAIDGFNTGRDCLVTWAPQRYVRAQHYFGENMASVYSELLNMATSWLCVRLSLAASHRSHVEQWLLTLATVHVIQSLAAATSVELLRALDESCAFATAQLARIGFDRRLDQSRRGHPLLDGSVRDAIGKAMSAWTRDTHIRRTARLMRRVRRYDPRGRLVATHAMHLLLNKAGLSLADEQYLLCALCRIARDMNEERHDL